MRYMSEDDIDVIDQESLADAEWSIEDAPTPEDEMRGAAADAIEPEDRDIQTDGIDPAIASVVERGNGSISDWEVYKKGEDGYTFDGENIRDGGGEIWTNPDSAMHEQIIAAFKEGETTVPLPDHTEKRDEGDCIRIELYVTQLHLSENRISWSIVKNETIIWKEKEEGEENDPARHEAPDAGAYASEWSETFPAYLYEDREPALFDAAEAAAYAGETSAEEIAEPIAAGSALGEIYGAGMPREVEENALRTEIEIAPVKIADAVMHAPGTLGIPDTTVREEKPEAVAQTAPSVDDREAVSARSAESIAQAAHQTSEHAFADSAPALEHLIERILQGDPLAADSADIPAAEGATPPNEIGRDRSEALVDLAKTVANRPDAGERSGARAEAPVEPVIQRDMPQQSMQESYNAVIPRPALPSPDSPREAPAAPVAHAPQLREALPIPDAAAPVPIAADMREQAALPAHTEYVAHTQQPLETALRAGSRDERAAKEFHRTEHLERSRALKSEAILRSLGLSPAPRESAEALLRPEGVLGAPGQSAGSAASRGGSTVAKLNGIRMERLDA